MISKDIAGLDYLLYCVFASCNLLAVTVSSYCSTFSTMPCKFPVEESKMCNDFLLSIAKDLHGLCVIYIQELHTETIGYKLSSGRHLLNLPLPLSLGLIP